MDDCGKVGLFREVPEGQLYLERCEAALMGALVREVNQGDYERARLCLELLQGLSIV